jgi:hypothetical protein
MAASQTSQEPRLPLSFSPSIFMADFHIQSLLYDCNMITVAPAITLAFQVYKRRTMDQESASHMIKARAHKGGVRIGKTPKKLASICCP